MDQLPKIARIFPVDWAAGRLGHDTKKAVQMGSRLWARSGTRKPGRGCPLMAGWLKLGRRKDAQARR